MLDKGHEIAVHGELHKAPGMVRPIDGIKDVLNCRLGLESMFGRIIRGMAYPDSGIQVFQNQASYENIRDYLADWILSIPEPWGRTTTDSTFLRTGIGGCLQPITTTPRF